ncbi:MAG: diguanylate cyclase [Azoarcus sp.]|jgi:diguanylate cyclase (GGDEF)-like protein|nr:diguanylate cyclase [Azoarcus sp.]
MQATVALRILKVFVVVLGVVSLVALWVETGAWAEYTETNIRAQLQLEARQRTRAAANSIQAMVGNYDLALRAMSHIVAQGRDTLTQKDGLAGILVPPLNAQLIHVDAEGYTAFSSQGPIPRNYVGDRAYFVQHRNKHSDRLLISEPMLDHETSAWVVPFSRAVWKDEQFVGVSVLNVPVENLLALLRRHQESQQDSLALILPGGQLLAHLLGANNAMVYGKSAPAQRPYLQQPELMQGEFEAVDIGDQTRRQFSWLRFPDTGLILSIGISPDEVLKPAHATIHKLEIASAAISALIVLLSSALLTALIRIERCERERNMRKTGHQELSNSMSEGLIEIDTDNRIAHVNPAFTTITGYPADVVIGKNIDMLSPAHRDIRSLGKMIAQWSAADYTGTAEGDFDGHRANSLRSGENGEPRAFIGHAVLVNQAEARQGVRRVVLLTDVSAIRRKEDEIWHEANYDALTGLVNRALCHDHLKLMVNHAHAHDCGVAVLFIDLDYFLPISEHRGAAVSNRLLYEVACRLRDLFHNEDTIARLRSDQFVVLISDYGAVSVAERAAARVVSRISDPFVVDAVEGTQIEITCSVGLARFPDGGHNADELLANSEQAMLRAKDKGRSSWSA